jgi:hypothetical protein
MRVSVPKYERRLKVKRFVKFIPEKLCNWYSFALLSIAVGQLTGVIFSFIFDRPSALINLISTSESLLFYRYLGNVLGEILGWGVGGVVFFWWAVKKSRQ